MWVGRHSASSVRVESPTGRTLRKVVPLVPLAAVASPHCAQCRQEQCKLCCRCCSAICTECISQQYGNNTQNSVVEMDVGRPDGANHSQANNTCNCGEGNQPNNEKKRPKGRPRSCGCF